MRFGDLLESFAKHAELFELEMGLANVEVVMNHYRAFRTEVEKAESSRLKDEKEREDAEKKEMGKVLSSR